MRLICDACGCAYVGNEDMHLKSEPNICCPHCEYDYLNKSNLGPRPKHTCKPAKLEVIMH